jgi:HK97 family phage major capsid protein
VSMTIPEARAEIRKLYDACAEIYKRYPDGLSEEINATDWQETKRLLTTIDGLEHKLGALEDDEENRKRVTGNLKRLTTPAESHVQPDPTFDPAKNGHAARAVRMFGEQFITSDEYKRVVDTGIVANPGNRVEMAVKLDGGLLEYLTRKALVYSGSGVGGPLIRSDRVPGLEFLFRQTTILDLIPTGTTTSNTIEYYEMTTSTNAAAPVAEATNSTGATGLKPEGALGWTLRSLPVATIAEWIPVTNQMLADAPGISSMINNQLLTHLQIALENQVISGNGTAPNMLGILTNPNIQTIGLGAGSGSAVDAALRAMTQVMVTGLSNPTGSVWNPIDFEAIRLARENTASATYGGYLMGPPNLTGPTTLWGRPAVVALGMPQDTALVADFTQMQLFDREQPSIRTGLANDDFLRNLQRILAELRAVFALFRPTAVCRVTGV